MTTFLAIIKILSQIISLINDIEAEEKQDRIQRIVNALSQIKGATNPIQKSMGAKALADGIAGL